MAIYFRSKDKKVRAIAQRTEAYRCRFQFFLRNESLSATAKQRLTLSYARTLGKCLPFSTRVRNRCVLTNRAGSVFRHFRLSRIMLKEFASQGLLAGVRKSSW